MAIYKVSFPNPNTKPGEDPIDTLDTTELKNTKLNDVEGLQRHLKDKTEKQVIYSDILDNNFIDCLYIGYKFITTPIVCTLSIPHGTSIAATPFTLTYTNKRLVSNPAFLADFSTAVDPAKTIKSASETFLVDLLLNSF